jgi:microcystin-dependent protein
MATLVITRNYDDDTALTEAQLDAAFDDLETLINTTKLNSDNIEDGGIDSDALAASSVTTAKIDNAAVTTAKLADSSVTTAKIADLAVTKGKIETAEQLPAGMIVPYCGTAAPTGWLLSYGQAISRTTYAVLFTAIGTTFGVGDGSTTFNVPDMRGRVAAGQDDMGGTSANRLTGQSGGVNGDTFGAVGGSEVHDLSEDEIPSHNHNYGTGVSLRVATTQSINIGTGPAVDVDGGSGVDTITGSTGGGDSHNNVQPTIVLNYIIKT